jgi:hypothetical protein
MTLYVSRGSEYHINHDADLKVLNRLPTGTYTVSYSLERGFYFDVIDNFKHEGKIYGDVMDTVKRFHQTYSERPAGTGILLEGDKGSGKTLLAKLLCIEGYKRDIITVVISQPWHGEQFNEFVQSIDQPAIFLFDEFEKVYDIDRDQTKILTLLDGTYNTKKMFVMTCNDRSRLSYYMLNRPGRFFYALKYRGLSQDFIQEYCEDNLKNKKNIEMIMRFAMTFDSFNFDILKAIVEEMNRYSEDLPRVLKFLNVSSTGSARQYVVKKFVIKSKDTEMVGYDKMIADGESVNVFEGFNMYFENKDENDDFYFVRFEPSHIIKMDSRGSVVAENDQAYIEAEVFTPPYRDYLSMLTD